MAGSLVEQLLGLPPAAAVRWFVNAWHGVPALPPPSRPSPIPSLLGQLLALGRTHPAICGRQNRLIDPVEVGDGLRCFYVENQAVYRWAYQPAQPDPVVVGQYRDLDGWDAWVPEQQRLDGFLLQVCLFEAVFSAPFTASAATQARPAGAVGVDVMIAAHRLEPLAYLPDRIRQHADRWEHADLGGFTW